MIKADTIDSRMYTEAELYAQARAGNLPGLLEPTTYGDHLFQEGSIWQPALNATVISYEPVRGSHGVIEALEPHAASGVRTSKNETHQNFVSQFTIRMSSDEAREIVETKETYRDERDLDTVKFDGVDPLHSIVAARFMPNIDPLTARGWSFTTVIRRLLGKLELNQLNTRQQAIWKHCGQASLSLALMGFSVDGERELPGGGAEPLFVPLVFFNAMISGKHGSQLALPGDTAYYSNIAFTPVAPNRQTGDPGYVDKVHRRDTAGLIRLDQESDVLGMCVNGHCNRTSAAAVADIRDVLGHTGIGGPETYALRRDQAWVARQHQLQETA